MLTPRPKLGFLGLGWIGQNRMQAIARSGLADIVVLADPSDAAMAGALCIAPEAQPVGGLEEMLKLGLDGVVIATPSALHAEQTIRALDAGLAVFCQKPLGRNAVETVDCVTAAARADRLLAVDLSYRQTAVAQALREAVKTDSIGKVFAADLTFHNAYGPGQPWFFDRAQSGGGCVIDLGVHLVDLALWVLDFPAITDVAASLYTQGRRSRPDEVEDYAVITLQTATQTTLRIACSWNLHAGCDAVIGAAFHGTAGGVSFGNVDGSFLDFVAHRHIGTRREALANPPDDWGGRAAVAWVRKLAAGAGHDRETVQLVDVAKILDRVYTSASAGR